MINQNKVVLVAAESDMMHRCDECIFRSIVCINGFFDCDKDYRDDGKYVSWRIEEEK